MWEFKLACISSIFLDICEEICELMALLVSTVIPLFSLMFVFK